VDVRLLHLNKPVSQSVSIHGLPVGYSCFQKPDIGMAAFFVRLFQDVDICTLAGSHVVTRVPTGHGKPEKVR